MPEGTQNLTFSGLVPGQNYYLMVDGYAGDVCSYSFTATSGIAVVDIIQGDKDLVVPMTMADEIYQAVQDRARLHILKESGHNPMIDAMDKVLEIIRG